MIWCSVIRENATMTPPFSDDPDIPSLGRRLTLLHQLHFVRLVRVWAPRCTSRDDAEDLVQDAFARLYRRYRATPLPADIPEDAVLLRVLHVTIRNLLIDHHRHSAAQRDHEAISLALNTAFAQNGPSAQIALPPIEWDHSVEDAVAANQLLDRLLARLDPHWARVLALLCEDFSPAEIGAAMGGRNGHVLVRRAREHICRLLADFAAAGDRAASWMALRFCRVPPVASPSPTIPLSSE